MKPIVKIKKKVRTIRKTCTLSLICMLVLMFSFGWCSVLPVSAATEDITAANYTESASKLEDISTVNQFAYVIDRLRSYRPAYVYGSTVENWGGSDPFYSDDELQSLSDMGVLLPYSGSVDTMLYSEGNTTQNTTKIYTKNEEESTDTETKFDESDEAYPTQVAIDDESILTMFADKTNRSYSLDAFNSADANTNSLLLNQYDLVQFEHGGRTYNAIVMRVNPASSDDEMTTYDLFVVDAKSFVETGGADVTVNGEGNPVTNGFTGIVFTDDGLSGYTFLKSASVTVYNPNKPSHLAGLGSGQTGSEFTNDHSANQKEATLADQIGFSMEDISSAMVTYINNVVGPNGNNKHSGVVETPITAGNAGAYVGYGRAKDNFSGFITSSLSHGAQTSSYTAWMNTTTTDADTKQHNHIYEYLRFGHVLEDAGLDDTATSGVSLGWRPIIGLLITVSYVVSELIPKLFSFTFTVLKWLNPFQFFGLIKIGGVKLADFSYWANATPAAQTAAFGPALAPLVSWVSNLFYELQQIGIWLTAPLSLGLASFLAFSLKGPKERGDIRTPGSQFKNAFLRTAGVIIVLPLAAGAYTMTLSQLQEFTANKTASTQMIVATFVDFKAWAENTNLAVTNDKYSDILIQSAPSVEKDLQKKASKVHVDSSIKDVTSGEASAEMMRSLRETVFNLNQMTDDTGTLGGKIGSLISGYNNKNHATLTGGMWDAYGQAGAGLGGSKEEEVASANAASVTAHVTNMLWRYSKGDLYQAADYESEHNRWLIDSYPDAINGAGASNSTYYTASNQTSVYGMYDATANPSNWMYRTEDVNKTVWTGQAASDAQQYNMLWVDRPWSLFNNGTLKSDLSDATDIMTFSSTSGEKGLSTMSMYNYLLTQFGDTSVTIYSPSDSLSSHTKRMHMAVNIIGSGAFRFMYTLNVMVLIGIFVLIALMFTVTTLYHTITQGFELFKSIPFAAVGVMTGLYQVLIITVTMIAEVIGSAFLYIFICELFVTVAVGAEETASAITKFGDAKELGSTILFNKVAAIMPGDIADSKTAVLLLLVVETAAVIALFGLIWHYRKAIRYELIRLNNKALAWSLMPEVKSHMNDMREPVSCWPDVVILMQT